VTAPARLLGWRACVRHQRAASTALLIAALLRSSPAAAQTSAVISIFSDDRYRGYSLSNGDPVGILDLSYDAADGFYGALSGTVAASHGGTLRPVGLVVNAGYAKRQSSGITVDVGAVHSTYSRYFERMASETYTELYVGVSGKLLSARVYASPDYRPHGTIYGELDGTVPIDSRLRFTGHIGMLVPLRSSTSGGNYHRDVDWRLGITRKIGAFSIQAAWTAVRPGHDSYGNRSRHRNALVVGASYAL
jgi:uncharacterized protein (TIGR02001 family)